jgi:hypothetical protein
VSEVVGSLRYVAWVIPDGDGWKVSCSCGYLVWGLPTQAIAQANMDNHVARCHAPEDDAA